MAAGARHLLRDLRRSACAELLVELLDAAGGVEDDDVEALAAGNVCVNDVIVSYAAPALPFGGVKESGIGRETHKVMLDHYQQTKNLLVSYSPKKLGFF